jgi:hypothetical protein
MAADCSPGRKSLCENTSLSADGAKVSLHTVASAPKALTRSELREIGGITAVSIENTTGTMKTAAILIGIPVIPIVIIIISIVIFIIPIGIMAMSMGIVAMSVGIVAVPMGIMAVPIGIVPFPTGIAAFLVEIMTFLIAITAWFFGNQVDD